jgi:hypothetical protein
MNDINNMILTIDDEDLIKTEPKKSNCLNETFELDKPSIIPVATMEIDELISKITPVQLLEDNQFNVSNDLIIPFECNSIIENSLITNENDNGMSNDLIKFLEGCINEFGKFKNDINKIDVCPNNYLKISNFFNEIINSCKSIENSLNIV